MGVQCAAKPVEQPVCLSEATFISFPLPFGSYFRHHSDNTAHRWLETTKVKSLGFGTFLIEGYPFFSKFSSLDFHDVRYRISDTLLFMDGIILEQEWGLALMCLHYLPQKTNAKVM